MTVAVPGTLLFDYAGDGVTTSFAYTNFVHEAGDLVVVLEDANGVQTVQEINTQYTVSGVGTANVSANFLDAPASGEKVYLYRDTARKQTVDLEDSAFNPANTTETQLDRLTRITQDLAYQASRAVMSGHGHPAYTLPEWQEDALLGWNDDADDKRLVNRLSEGQSAAEAEDAAQRAEDAAQRAENAASGVELRAPYFFNFMGNGSVGPYDVGEEIPVASTIAVFFDGAYMAPGVDFTFSGSEITFTTVTPDVDNQIQGYVFAVRPLGIASEIANSVAFKFTAVAATREVLKAIDTKRHIAALLTEGGRSGNFVWDPTVSIATHQADTQEGIFLAPNPAADGAWRRLHGSALELSWWGLQGGVFDNEPVFVGAFNYIKSLGPNHLGSAILNIPAGRYQTRPVTSDIAGVQIVGSGKFATEINGFTAGQGHVFRFTNTGTGSVRMKWLMINGWRGSEGLSAYPTYGIIFEGGSNHFEEMRVYRCRTGIWGLRGNFNRFRDLEIGFFDVAGIRLGHAPGPSSTISENRITRCSIFSGANSHGGGDGTYAGAQIILSTNCAATIIENSEGGSTFYGIRIYDGLGLGEAFAPGHVFLRGYTSGVCRDIGLWVQHNGGFVNAVNCSFSATGAGGSADGVNVASSSTNGSVRLIGCSFHECRRAGIYINGGYSVWAQGCVFRAVGASGSVGYGMIVTGGPGKVVVQSSLFDQDWQANASGTGRVMDYGIRVQGSFSGEVHDVGNFYKNVVTADVAKVGAVPGSVTRYQYDVTTL